MRFIRLLSVSAAALALTYAVPAAAQTFHQSWEGATHEMQKRGPGSTIHGPGWDGRILVTPGYAYGYGHRHFRRHHPRPYYGMAPRHHYRRY